MPKSSEFILQPNLLSVVLVEPYGPGFAGVMEKLGPDAKLQLVECVSTADTVAVVRQMSSCLVLIHANTAQTVAQHLVLLKVLAPQIRVRKSVRVVVMVSPSITAEWIEKFTVRGCSEIISDDTPIKSILFKLDRHIRALPMPSPVSNEMDAQHRSRLDANPSEANIHAAMEMPAETEMPPPAAGVRLAPSLKLDQDCWCLAGGGARRVDGRWQIRMRGPMPDQGRWRPVRKFGDLWQWCPTPEATDEARSENEPLVEAHAQLIRTGWCFAGSARPEYRQGHWIFVSSRPSLGYFKAEEAIGYKFSLNEKGSLVVAQDSEPARSGLALPRGKVTRKFGPAQAQAPLRVDPSDIVAQVVYVDPLQIASDFWLIETHHPKRIIDRWLLQVVGPGPSVGRWIAQKEQNKKGGDLEKWWRWVPEAGEGDPFLIEQGSWAFYGLSPHFSRGLWIFASTSPELGFYYGGSSYGDKFRLRDDGVLEVARDSLAARSALSMLKLSLERKVAPKKRAAVVDALPLPAGAPGRPQRAPEEPLNEEISRQDSPRASGAASLSATDSLAGLTRIFASDVPGPTLSSVALAFLASELAAKRQGSLRSRCDRYCAYLYASFGGLRTELWAQDAQDQWFCVGTSDGGEGQYRDCARSGPGVKALRQVPMRITEVRPALQNPIGLLIVGGRGAQKIHPSYAHAASRIAVGLVLAARAEMAQDAESAKGSIDEDVSQAA